jgi:hypothetical protein
VIENPHTTRRRDRRTTDSHYNRREVYGLLNCPTSIEPVATDPDKLASPADPRAVITA